VTAEDGDRFRARWLLRTRAGSAALTRRSRRVKINHPGHFVAGDQRLTDDEDTRSAVSVVVQVRPADTDVAHPEPHLPGIWLGAGNLLGPHILLAMDPHGPHALILSLEEAPSGLG
jgi:hypothetical protein